MLSLALIQDSSLPPTRHSWISRLNARQLSRVEAHGDHIASEKGPIMNKGLRFKVMVVGLA